ncbi:unnamed protein product [Bursaphelenchus xylophilus]|uniref:(pine wood nematode) hypothetical protein n=1 Tax=Bursaphelenchus xylophilus TaxID=6326 RepID=A0A1I7RYX8_BURXY|nr:unnamed protein product [Bursaphelenchus xylophilus]CAG9092056.1 unnamed protein product [Bursaphelenchus xylophilus]
MPKRGKQTLQRRRRRQDRGGSRSYSTDSDGLGEEIKEVFDQMDFIYGELEVVVNADSFIFSNVELSEMDGSLDYVYEQIGKWLVGYCGCLVQREQTGHLDIDALENLLDRLLGICYQMESWIKLVDHVLQNPEALYGTSELPPQHEKDAHELRRRRSRVTEVQTYLEKLKQRHASHLITNDHRAFQDISTEDLDRLSYRYARFTMASFPSSCPQELFQLLLGLKISQIPELLHNLPFDGCVPVQNVTPTSEVNGLTVNNA